MPGHMGIGAMLSYLGGNSDSVLAVQRALGKTIKRIVLEDSSDTGPRYTRGRGRDGRVLIEFEGGGAIALYDDARSCCESRWMSTDDDLAYHVGAKLHSLEVRDGPTTNEDYETKECQFLHIVTDRGTVVVNTYNHHNGYYGGIAIRAQEVSEIPGAEVHDDATDDVIDPQEPLTPE